MHLTHNQLIVGSNPTRPTNFWSIGMTNKSIQELIYGGSNPVEISRVEMYKSLMNAIDFAGGSKEFFHERIGKGMTVVQLIDDLAQNGVRFTRK
jgi:hypothetical protein